MKRYNHWAVALKKDKNILTIVVEKVDSDTGEVVGQTSYVKDINKTEDESYNWYRVLKNGNISEKISYLPTNLNFRLENYDSRFICDFAKVFWDKNSFGYNYNNSLLIRKGIMLYIDILMSNKSTSMGMCLENIVNSIRELTLTENNMSQFFMELLEIRKGCEDVFEYQAEIRGLVDSRKSKEICEKLHITAEEFSMLKTDGYWYDDFYRTYLKDDTNATILYLKLYNAYRTIMPCNTLYSLIYNAIKKAHLKKIEYKVKGNPMDIIKSIADAYAKLEEQNEKLVTVNEIFKKNQTSIPLEFENDKFIVKVPTTYKELLTEGTALRNCLGHYEYNNFVRNGRRRVVFIRRKNFPDKSYIACDIDVYTNDIQQYLRYGNERVIDTDALDFKEKYQEYLYSLEVNSDTDNTSYLDSDLTEKRFNQW